MLSALLACRRGLRQSSLRDANDLQRPPHVPAAGVSMERLTTLMKTLALSTAVLFLLTVSSCGSTHSNGGDAGTDTGGQGGTTGAGGQAGGSAGGRGGGSAGSGGSSSGCDGTCQLGTYCTGCGNGGTKKLACSCYIDSAGVGRWSCGSLGPCGSNGCGPMGVACDPKYQTSCESCDGTGARQSCTCVTSGSQGTWACASTAGSCGVACGDHRCLPGELCVNLGQYGGFPIDGGTGEPTLRPTCVVVPDACGSQPPSCAACIVSAYGCSLPGVCRDVGPQTFDCILGGA